MAILMSKPRDYPQQTQGLFNNIQRKTGGLNGFVPFFNAGDRHERKNSPDHT